MRSLFCLIDLVVIELVTFSYHARNTVYGRLVYGLLEVKEIQCTVSKKFNKYSPIRTRLVYYFLVLKRRTITVERSTVVELKKKTAERASRHSTSLRSQDVP